MIVYDEEYGADADGNRGVMITNVELESSDRQWILEMVRDQNPEMFDEEPIGGKVYLTVIDPRNEEDIDIEINLEEWL